MTRDHIQQEVHRRHQPVHPVRIGEVDMYPLLIVVEVQRLEQPVTAVRESMVQVDTLDRVVVVVDGIAMKQQRRALPRAW